MKKKKKGQKHHPPKKKKKKKKGQKQYNIKHKTKKCLTVSMLYAKSPIKKKMKRRKKLSQKLPDDILFS